MSSKLDFLRNLDIFERLNPVEMAALASLAEEYDYPAGAAIAYQRDVADGMFVVCSGRLVSVSVDESGEYQTWQRFMAGQLMTDVWLFSPDPYPGTVKATRDSRLIYINGERFRQFMIKYPAVLARLSLSPDAEAAARRGRVAATQRRYGAVRLLPDELLEFEARRSRWLLLIRGIVPLLGLLFLPLLIYLGLQRYFVVTGLWAIIIPALPAVLMGMWLLFAALDWYNDFFIITNKHLVHYEFDLRLFRSSVNKTPIDQVQSVEIEKPNIWSNLFKVGTARITTASASGTIFFDFIDDPGEVQATLSRLRRRVKDIDAGHEQEAMRLAVEGHFGAPALQSKIEEPLPPEVEAVLQPTSLDRVRAVFEAFRNSFASRVEEGGVITYRKHFFVLLQESRVPLSMIGILILLALLLRWLNVHLGWVLYAIPFSLLLMWLSWRLEDWRNDTFQLTDRYVIDIDRRPFGFGESRKQAELGNVQNVSADRPNFWATVFNFGLVQIETAGATSDITFEAVVDPNRIQSEIFNRRERFKRQQQEGARDQRRSEYALLVDVYKQAEEQGRIPKRTPNGDLSPFDEDEDVDGFASE